MHIVSHPIVPRMYLQRTFRLPPFVPSLSSGVRSALSEIDCMVVMLGSSEAVNAPVLALYWIRMLALGSRLSMSNFPMGMPTGPPPFGLVSAASCGPGEMWTLSMRRSGFP